MAGGSRTAILLGVLGVLVLPVAIALTRFWEAYTLLHSGLAVPVAALLGVVTLVRTRRQRVSVRGVVADRGRNLARRLGVVALGIASSGVIALLVYGVLTWLGTRK